MTSRSRLLLGLVLPWGFLLAACSESAPAPAGGAAPAVTTAAPASGPGAPAVLALGGGRVLAAPVSAANLTVWPILGEAAYDPGEFLSLHEAQERGVVEIREGDQESVGRLWIENRGDDPVLVPAGTVVKGGKQDRQLGRDVVILAGDSEAVEAFCVERGRWSSTRQGVSTAGQFASTGMVAVQRVRARAHYAKDQGQVWEEVSRINRRAVAENSTGTLLGTLEQDDEVLRARIGHLEQAVRGHFAALGGQSVVGFAYAVNGEPLTVRTYAHPRLFQKQFGSFRRTMCLEAALVQARDIRAGKPVFDRPADAEHVARLVASVSRGEVRTHRIQAHRRDLERRTAEGGNTACQLLVADAGASEERWVTLTEDWTSSVDQPTTAAAEVRALGSLGYSE